MIVKNEENTQIKHIVSFSGRTRKLISQIERIDMEVEIDNLLLERISKFVETLSQEELDYEPYHNRIAFIFNKYAPLKGEHLLAVRKSKDTQISKTKIIELKADFEAFAYKLSMLDGYKARRAMLLVLTLKDCYDILPRDSWDYYLDTWLIKTMLDCFNFTKRENF